MTTINSDSSNVELSVNTYGDDVSLYLTKKAHSITINRGRLLAALDAVPRAEVDELGCGCPEADANLKGALERAEAAEAKLAKVQAWRDGDEQFDRLDAILNPRPAFELPTEAGAGITAVFGDPSFGSDRCELRLFSDGLWRSARGRKYTPEGVMEHYTNHRLIGAES